jgi:uncharacterized protein YlzI (FlbEa/FlbD family)
MILVHKLKGEELWVNPDLIAMVEGNHDTVLTLLDGRHVTVADRPEEIASSIRHHRALTLALAFRLHDDGVTAAPLRLVPSGDEG